MTLFFQSTRTGRNNSTKFCESLWFQIGPFGTRNLMFPFFSAQHTISGETKGSPFSFFDIVRFFFQKKSHQRVLPSIFFMFGNRMDVEKSQRVLFFVFFGIVRHFLSKKIPQRVSPSFFHVLQQWMLNKFKNPNKKPALDRSFGFFESVSKLFCEFDTLTFF